MSLSNMLWSNPAKQRLGRMVLPSPGGGIQVVIQGFMKHRFMLGQSVAIDGFHKYPDDTGSEMKAEEFWKFNQCKYLNRRHPDRAGWNAHFRFALGASLPRAFQRQQQQQKGTFLPG
jgi:hypothetical protein